MRRYIIDEIKFEPQSRRRIYTYRSAPLPIQDLLLEVDFTDEEADKVIDLEISSTLTIEARDHRRITVTRVENEENLSNGNDFQ
jgi:hypothetical protein